MSLDVYLEIPVQLCQSYPRGLEQRDRSGIYIRRDGQTAEISREKWDRLYPGREPVIVKHFDNSNIHEVYHSNITHNLVRMAKEVDLYMPLWRPEEMGIKLAKDLIKLLRDGLSRLNSEQERLQEFNPSNGWGNYDGLVQFTTNYLAACERWPEAKVRVSR